MSFLSKFFKEPDSSALGIDIGSSAIKIVQLRKKNGQAILETYGELALGPYDGKNVGQSASLPPDKISQALIDLMNEKEVSVTTKKCGVSIPFSSSLISVIEMPEVSAKQLSVMIPLEARRYIPVPISDVMLDWSIIPKSEERLDVSEDESLPQAGSFPGHEDKQIAGKPKIDVLTVAIHKDTIAKYQEIVTGAGLDTGFFEIEIFSTMRAVLDDSVRPVMIMDMGSASTKLYVVERGIIRSSHTINRGSQDITSVISKSLNIPMEEAEIMKRRVGLSAEDKNLQELITLVLDNIFAEINNVLLAFEKRYNKTISKVILVGGGSSLKNLAEYAKDNIKADAIKADPFSKVLTPAFLEAILKETGPEFAVAIGLALRRLAE
jgi:type IV pilus assembly protein PilM